jgi:hypothetical protein
MKFKDIFINEEKQVGTLYRGITYDWLKKYIINNKQIKLGLNTDKSPQYTLSTSSDPEIARDYAKYPTDGKKYSEPIIIELDGNKISNNYKLTRLRDAATILVGPITNNNNYDNLNHKEELITGKNNIYIKDYITKIYVMTDIIESKLLEYIHIKFPNNTYRIKQQKKITIQDLKKAIKQ